MKKSLLALLLFTAIGIVACSKKNDSNVVCDQFGNCTNNGINNASVCSTIGQQCSIGGVVGVCQSNGATLQCMANGAGNCQNGSLGCGGNFPTTPPGACTYHPWYYSCEVSYQYRGMGQCFFSYDQRYGNGSCRFVPFDPRYPKAQQ